MDNQKANTHESSALRRDNLTLIDGSALETNLENSTVFSPSSSWNNDAYLDDIRKQIRKEWPTIDEDELEKIVKQFESKDVVSVSTFSPTLNYDSDQKYKSSDRRNVKLNKNDSKKVNETNKSNRTVSNRKYNKPFIEKVKRNEWGSRVSKPLNPNQNSLNLNSKIDYKSEQSRSEMTVNDGHSSKYTGDLEYDQYLDKNDNCNKTETENELNSRILGQINSLLEQQFNLLRDELKANKSLTDKNNDENNSNAAFTAEKSYLNSESNKIKSKFKSAYIPEGEYNIEQINGVKRVINKPFISNILEQKKFNTIFKVKPTKSIKDEIVSKTDNPKMDELVEQSKSNKVSVKKDKFKIQNEDGKLNIGDYDSLY